MQEGWPLVGDKLIVELIVCGHLRDKTFHLRGHVVLDEPEFDWVPAAVSNPSSLQHTKRLLTAEAVMLKTFCCKISIMWNCCTLPHASQGADINMLLVEVVPYLVSYMTMTGVMDDRTWC